jgi:hypothetical protein
MRNGKPGKSIIFIISLVLNAIFILFVVMAITGKTSVISFYNMDEGDTRFATAALIVSIPFSSGSVVYEPVNITLRTGDTASLQISATVDRKQSNRLITALYDRRIISLTENGYGVIITALDAGTTTMQTLTEDGIVDIALITVTD